MNGTSDIFKDQKKALQRIQENFNKEEQQNNCTLVKFDCYHKHYAIHIKHIHEIIESSEVIPYPEKIQNHVGIINLRGRIIPVINILVDENSNEENKSLKTNVIILEFSNQKIFAIKTNKIQKFIFDDSSLESGQTINLNGIPTYYMEENEFNFV